MTEKLKWCWNILRSKSYIVLTDEGGVVSIPLMNMNAFESQFLLAAQQATLKSFVDRLEGVVKEHDEAIKLLAHRKKYNSSSKKKNGVQSKVQSKTPRGKS